ncbi:nucleotide exchange factor GrpE [Longirhabdus pacifica]|uniref:nucleotide exchange factor GrpE n=1 Tax=Longirhabdus pacifica TaxID=2305227 RepID=UPI001F0BB8A0|nr:nucleotide exchange factor GrpE [Longirhabdus pacifica]
MNDAKHTHNEGDLLEQEVQKEESNPEAMEQTTDEVTNEETPEEVEAPTEQEQSIGDHGELLKMEKKIQEQEDRFLRLQAEFENFKRRTRKEKEDLRKYAAIDVITGLLPVLDNFERALAASETTKDFDSLVKGLDMVFKQMQPVLEQEGLTQIDAVNQPFNPEFHQAIMQVESDEHEEGIVVEEVQKGYMLKEKVLRPSMVKVSS